LQNGVLVLKEPTKPYPVGSENAPVVLMWRKTSSNEDDLPMKINFWAQSESRQTVVTVEVDLVNKDFTLHNVYIHFPTKTSEKPSVKTPGDVNYSFNARDKSFTWNIDELSADKSQAEIEFSIPEVDPETFYPITVSFVCSQLYSNVVVQSVKDVQSSADKEFAFTAQLSAGSYTIV